MAIVEPVVDGRAVVMTQKLGRPNGFGHIRFGWSHFGDRNDYAGYYQRRRGVAGPIIVRTRHYWPPQNPGTAEQARRVKFADGVVAWHALSAEQKAYYNDLKYPRRQSGFTRYMSLYMRDLL